MGQESACESVQILTDSLVKAHAKSDRAVDLCYRPQTFTSERPREEYLFGFCEQLTAALLPATKPKWPRKCVSV